MRCFVHYKVWILCVIVLISCARVAQGLKSDCERHENGFVLVLQRPSPAWILYVNEWKERWLPHVRVQRCDYVSEDLFNTFSAYAHGRPLLEDVP